MLFWGNEVLTEIGGVLEFYGKENAVRRQWEREEKEEKKENLEGKQRNSKNRTALDTQKEETMDWNTAFAVLRKFYEEKWDYLNGCPRNEKAWDEEGELQCKIYVSKKRGLDRDQRMEVLKLYETMDFYVLYNRFLKKEGYQTLPRRPLEKRKLRYEDVYPVLYLKYRLSRQAERSNIKHLVIDEMQDYSRLQYLIIRRMFSCKMTILGDRAQTMADQQQDVLQFLPGIFGKDLRRIEMRKSYRNTVEIASYAANLIGVTDLELFERHGIPVVERDVTDLEAALREAVDTLFPEEKTYETAAVIVPDEKTAERAYLILREILAEKDFDCEKRLSWLNRDSSSFKKGLTVTTFYLAKGLEFDQVFSIFPKDEKREIMMQAQYIAATRALHELRVYHI